MTCMRCYHTHDEEEPCDSKTCTSHREYWKARDQERMNWERGPRIVVDFEGIVSAVFHVGFIGIEETDEHLAELRKPPPKGSEKEDETNLGYQRSRIATTSHFLSPIDAMALKVTRMANARKQILRALRMTESDLTPSSKE